MHWNEFFFQFFSKIVWLFPKINLICFFFYISEIFLPEFPKHIWCASFNSFQQLINGKLKIYSCVYWMFYPEVILFFNQIWRSTPFYPLKQVWRNGSKSRQYQIVLLILLNDLDLQMRDIVIYISSREKEHFILNKWYLKLFFSNFYTLHIFPAYISIRLQFFISKINSTWIFFYISELFLLEDNFQNTYGAQALLAWSILKLC